MPKLLRTQGDRERALFRYHNSLLRGDFDTLTAIMELAQDDAILWQMLMELHEQDDVLLTGEDELPLMHPDIIIYQSASNGAFPESYSEEDKIMNITNPIQNPQLGNFPYRLSSIVATLLLFISLSATFVITLLLPIGNNIGQLIQLTQIPLKAGCQLTTTAPAPDESLRLIQASEDVLDMDEPDKELAILLSICALQTSYSQEADDALQQAMVDADLVPNFATLSYSYYGAQLSPDGRYLLTAYNSDGAHLWDVATGEEVHLFPGGPYSIDPSVAFSPDGQYIITTFGPTSAKLWDVETGTSVRDFEAGRNIVSIVMSPNGTLIALGLDNGHVQLWETSTGLLQSTISAHTYYVAHIAFSPNSRNLLVSGNGPGTYPLQLWDIKTGAKIREFLGLNEPQGGIFSPDGRYVIAGGRPTDPRAILWDTATGAEIHTFTDFPANGGYNHVQAFAFTPDGRYVLIGSANHTAKIYEVETGVEVRSFNDNPGYITTVGFSPDGKWLFIRGNVVRIWSTDYHDMIADACRGIRRDFTPEERIQYSLRDGVPTCPQLLEGYTLEPGMTAIPTQPIPVWTPLPTLKTSEG